VSDYNINEQWAGQHTWQPDMPSGEEAWNKMLLKLEEEMPVATATQAGKQKPLPDNSLYLIVLLLLLWNVQHRAEKDNTVQASVHTAKSTTTNTPAGKQQAAIGLSNKTFSGTPAQTKERRNKAPLLRMRTANNSKPIFNLRNKWIPGKEILIGKNEQLLSEVSKTDSSNTFTFNNNKINVQPSKETKQVDSLPSNNDDEVDQLSVQAGLQWTASLPIAGTQNYFTGPSANEQAWRMLLPGAWVQFKMKKDLLTAEVNPFAAASFNPKSFYSTSEMLDTQRRITTYKSLSKVFGISGTISYQRSITNNWWLGGGLQANFWNKGVAVLTTNKHDFF
jgi:hypothetical protein